MGAVCTDVDGIAIAARRLKAHGRACICRKCVRGQGKCPLLDGAGSDPRFTHYYPGYNAKANEFVAALARVQLRHIAGNILCRLNNMCDLEEILFDLEADELIEPHVLQPGMVPMAYPIILKRKGIRQDVLIGLEERGVECRPLFGCLPTQQPAFAQHHQASGSFPVAEHYGADGLYVGCHQYLSGGQIEDMGKAIVEVVRKVSR